MIDLHKRNNPCKNRNDAIGIIGTFQYKAQRIMINSTKNPFTFTFT